MPQSTAWFGMTAASSRNVERRGSRRHHAPYVVGMASHDNVWLAVGGRTCAAALTPCTRTIAKQ